MITIIISINDNGYDNDTRPTTSRKVGHYRCRKENDKRYHDTETVMLMITITISIHYDDKDNDIRPFIAVVRKMT